MATVQKVVNGDGSVTLRVRFDVPAGPVPPGRLVAERARRSKSFRIPAGATRAHARAVEDEARSFAHAVELRGEAVLLAERLTVGQFAQQYLRAKAARRGGATMQSYRGLLRNHIVPAFGHRPLARVTALEVEVWLAEQLASGAAAATVQDRWGMLRRLFRDAVAKRLIAWNPCDGVEAPPGGRGRERTLTQDEEARYVAAMAGDPLEALWRVLLYGGLRIGEAVALRWTDFQGEWLSVTRTETRGEGGRSVREGTKTHRSRRVLLDHGTLDAFAFLKLVQQASPWCFTRADGSRLNATAARGRLAVLRRRAGLAADISPHVLRHTHISRLREFQVSYAIIAERVGHRSLATTLGYDHPDDDAHRRAVGALEAWSRLTGGRLDGG